MRSAEEVTTLINNECNNAVADLTPKAVQDLACELCDLLGLTYDPHDKQSMTMINLAIATAQQAKQLTQLEGMIKELYGMLTKPSQKAFHEEMVSNEEDIPF